MARSPRRSPKRYSIVVRPKAVDDLESIFAYIALDAPANAERFHIKLIDAIERLQTFPERHAEAPESAAFSFVIRQRVVGRYRIMYTVDGDNVRILRVRSTFQDTVLPEDVEE